MLQLTYISTAVHGMSPSLVEDILRVSRWNNSAAGVTGLLVYDGVRFLQALEGDTDEVNAIFARVKTDRRHRAVLPLATQHVETRAFGDWAMAAQRVAAGNGDTIAELVDALTASVADRSMRAMFRGFARLRMAA